MSGIEVPQEFPPFHHHASIQSDNASGSTATEVRSGEMVVDSAESSSSSSSSSSSNVGVNQQCSNEPPSALLSTVTTIAAAATFSTSSFVTTTSVVTSTSNNLSNNTSSYSSGVSGPLRRPAPPSIASYQPAAKRARYEGCILSNKPTTTVEVRQALMKWKHGKMDAVRDSYNSHVAEYFFLKHNRNLMDMNNFLRKPTPELLAYHKLHRLEGDSSNLSYFSSDSSLKLSAGSLGSGYKKEDQQDQMVEKARHEANVVARIAQLRKEGLWTEKRLPKVHEPSRPKCHWDYLLEEMVWLSADFAQERKWKKAAAKKCAKMVQKYFQDKELAAERAQKEEEMRLRKIASFMAREVRTFWSNVEKLVHYKITSKHEEKKKKALDQQLSFIVDQTEKYSGMLAESMKRPSDSSAQSTHSETPSVVSFSDDEFEPSGNSDDDEATILKEDDDPNQQADELRLLQQESSQTIDDLLTSLPPEYLAGLRFQAHQPEETKNAEDTVDRLKPLGESDEQTLKSKGTVLNDCSSDSRSLQSLTENSITNKLGVASEDTRTLIHSVTRSGRLRTLSSAAVNIPEDKNRLSSSVSDTNILIDSLESSVNSKQVISPLSINDSSTALSKTSSSNGCGDPSVGSVSDVVSKNVTENMDVDDPDTGDVEYVGEEEDDEEDTLAEQEKHEGQLDYQQEIKELEEDNELSLEELRNKYASLPLPDTPSTPNAASESEHDLSSDDSDDDLVSVSHSVDMSASEDDEDGVTGSSDDSSDEECDDVGLKSLLEDSSVDSQSRDSADAAHKADQQLEEATAVAEALQPKGFTLSSTAVTTPVPFLLKHTLREYQHVGLDWLVTMFDKRLNGILADEMGLGKTIQTISLLAHLACETGNWGPHLIVVPTSVMLNWEMELKKWCPAFKILTYFGTQKERKMKRTGWTKLNAFHVCITSYKLVIQDHQSFRRKKWKYFILDEAQNIKNFKSKRWQLLLNFQSDRRLLLTGTPLQNNLMELWSLMHFLMPHVFASHREFREWFSNPVTGMIQGNSEYNDNIIKRLHKVLRPFILRRLKSEVEQQMPKKYEHVVMCRLSKRQRFLYEEFMSRTKTMETLATGNFLSVINVLMQLRKVCNHPNLFEERATVSPFMMEPLSFTAPSCCWNITSYDPFKHVDLFSLNLLLCDLELLLTAFAAHRIRRFQCSHRFITEIDSAPPPPPRCPPGKIRLHVRQSNKPSCNVAAPTVPPPSVRQQYPRPLTAAPSTSNVRYQLIQHQGSLRAIPIAVNAGVGNTIPHSSSVATTSNSLSRPLQSSVTSVNSTKLPVSQQPSTALQGLQLMHTPSGQLLLTTASRPQQQLGTTAAVQQGLSTGSASALLQKLQSIQGIKSLQGSVITMGPGGRPVLRLPPPAVAAGIAAQGATVNSSAARITPQGTPQPTPQATPQSTPHPTPLPSPTPTSSPVCVPPEPRTARSLRGGVLSTPDGKSHDQHHDEKKSVFYLSELEEMRLERRRAQLSLISRLNTRKCRAYPIYGGDLIEAVTVGQSGDNRSIRCWRVPTRLKNVVLSSEDRLRQLQSTLCQFLLYVPAVVSRSAELLLHHPAPSAVVELRHKEQQLQQHILQPVSAALHSVTNSTLTQFPDARLIQYDCGKLQTLDHLLRRLKEGTHRVLIFTQMTRMLDVFEAFLNYHGHIYLRLDGTTKVQDRQVLMERFNQDKRIFVFILSTRSGGIGVNLTGADTVIFYDSDWNPTMDAQAQDRCHRIGQTRDVHIYRLISEKTIEENILKKANQKRMLGNLAIEGGNFTTAYFKEQTIKELFSVEAEQDASHRMAELLDPSATDQSAASHDSSIRPGALESALAAAEDETDVVAARHAIAEAAADLAEFDENIPLNDENNKATIDRPSRVQQEIDKLMGQLTGVERYAMQVLERADEGIALEQLRLEQQLEQQKRDWEVDRQRALLSNSQHMRDNEDDENDDNPIAVTSNQMWLPVSWQGRGELEVWLPPTPPRAPGDLYLEPAPPGYHAALMPETSLPPVYVMTAKHKRRRLMPAGPVGTRSIKQEETLSAPRSMFFRAAALAAASAPVKFRRDIKMHKFRSLPRGAMLLSIRTGGGIVGQVGVSKGCDEPWVEWCGQEDSTILLYIALSGGGPNALHAAHTLNWDLVADHVNQISRGFRSARSCRSRHDLFVSTSPSSQAVRQDGGASGGGGAAGVGPVPSDRVMAITASAMTTKSEKSPVKGIKSGRGGVSLTDNTDYTSDLSRRYGVMTRSRKQRAPPPPTKKVATEQINQGSQQRGLKQVQVLLDADICWETPLTPLQVAATRIEREKQRDKQKADATRVHQHQMLLLQQQQQQQQQHAVPVATGGGLVQQQQHVVTAAAVANLQQQQHIIGSVVVSKSGVVVSSAGLAVSKAALAATVSGAPIGLSVGATPQVVTVSSLVSGLPTAVIGNNPANLPSNNSSTGMMITSNNNAGLLTAAGAGLRSIATTTTCQPSPHPHAVASAPQRGAKVSLQELRPTQQQTATVVSMASLAQLQAAKLAQPMQVTSLQTKGGVSGARTLTPSQLTGLNSIRLHTLQQNLHLQQKQDGVGQQQAIKRLKIGPSTAGGQKVPVAVSAGSLQGITAIQVSQANRGQLLKHGGAVVSVTTTAAAAAGLHPQQQTKTLTRAVSEAEMTAILRRQQQQGKPGQITQVSGVVYSSSGNSAVSGTTVSTAGMAALMKGGTVTGGVAASQQQCTAALSVALPQQRATQHAKHVTTQQVVGKQRGTVLKSSAVGLQLGSKGVTGHAGGLGTLQIIQGPPGQKGGMQQIQVFKQVAPQTVHQLASAAQGGGVLTAGKAINVSSGAAATKLLPATVSHQGIKQTIQVVSAGGASLTAGAGGGIRVSAGSGSPALTLPASAVRMATPQLLSQVSAALQPGQAMRGPTAANVSTAAAAVRISQPITIQQQQLNMQQLHPQQQQLHNQQPQ